MHDRAVRRRRAVLVVLVAASLILLTAYYGESSDGRLHSVQRGALAALSPIQEGASRVLKPFRDLFGWFGDTLDAKDQRDKAIAERDRAAATSSRPRMNAAARGRAAGPSSTRSTRPAGMAKYGPGRRARVRALAQQLVPALRDQQGHRRRRPPRRPGDQRRRARRQGRGRRPAAASVVTLITDQSFATGGIAGASAASRAASRPPSARPATCCSSSSTPTPRCATGDLVYTAGTTDSRLRVALPAGDPDRHGRAHRPRRRRARPAHPHQARRRPAAASTWCRC